MARLSKLLVGTMLLVTLLAAVLTTGALAEDNNNTIEVVVSPNVLNLNSNGGSVSLHTDIDYAVVVVDGVELYVEDQLVEQIWTFADDRGDLVVKCNIDIVKGMVVVGEATFDLEVTTEDGTSFGTDTIAVIARGGK